MLVLHCFEKFHLYTEIEFKIDICLIIHLDFQPKINANKRKDSKRVPKHDGVVLKIDDDMLTMRWLKKFKRSLKEDKLQYNDNEYDCSGFNALNLNVWDSNDKESSDSELINK